MSEFILDSNLLLEACQVLDIAHGRDFDDVLATVMDELSEPALVALSDPTPELRFSRHLYVQTDKNIRYLRVPDDVTLDEVCNLLIPLMMRTFNQRILGYVEYCLVDVKETSFSGGVRDMFFELLPPNRERPGEGRHVLIQIVASSDESHCEVAEVTGVGDDANFAHDVALTPFAWLTSRIVAAVRSGIPAVN